MIETAVVHTDLTGSEPSGADLGSQIASAFGGERPDAVILFASPRYRHEELLRALDAACRPRVLVGCSSAGEFTDGIQGEGLACAVAFRSDSMLFRASIARDLRDGTRAAAELAAGFAGFDRHDFPYRSALVLTDALAGHADELVEQLTLRTAGTYQFFGGGAGDDANFGKTFVFCGTEVVSGAAVALEILSQNPLGIGVGHGWCPTGPALRVTEAEGSRVVSLNAAPAFEAFQDHAETTGQRLDPAEPVPFFLHNVLGIDTGGGYRLRVPLAVGGDGSITCAADVPAGSKAHIMGAAVGSSAGAAAAAARAALVQLGGRRPKLAIFFDCVATRLRLGREFGGELDAIREALGGASFAGCNTYGQVARAEGQFGGFHNCTAVICVIAE